jgi:hypothetical protein
MSDLERRSGSRPSRRKREQRAYNLVRLGGVLSLAFVVTLILALFTGLSWGWPITLAILAVICSLLFRRAVR